MRITRADVVLGILLIITLASAVTAWQTQQRLDRVTTCTTDVVNDLVIAVNQRTTYTEQSARQTRDLQYAQRDLLDTILRDGGKDERSRALRDYAQALSRYQEVASKAERARDLFPYPEKKVIDRCR